MSRVPFMPFFGNDFFGSSRVKLMSAEEKMAYLTLLWFQWVDDGLPVASDDLRKLTTDLTDGVLACFPVARDGKRRNSILETHRKSSVTMSKSRQKAAKSRWDKEKREMQNECETDAKTMPSVSVSVSVPEVSSVTNVTEAEPPPGSPFQRAMGTVREHLRNGNRPDARDGSVIARLLKRHPAEDVCRAVEGLRLLVDRGGLPPIPKGQELYATYLESNKWGFNVFAGSLDAYYGAGERSAPQKRQHSQPTGIGDVLGTMGVA